ncbi:MAG TPA: putative zinc-binding metallopeptidase, partial [Bdellovibrionota bacterium]|nr:putative zinc-binding metallopeptidase [Bdellovibrionota bacterium]
MKIRIKDLGLSVQTLDAPVRQVVGELVAKGLVFRPRFYLGDEWFSPEGVPAVSIPFAFAHPRLMALEREMLGELEGDDPSYFLRLLRHEVGHCLDHAYLLSRTRRWRTVFGSPAQEYDPDHFRPKAYSKAFVSNLQGHYAQSHPDEDFAETFAVWLDPSRDWKREYARRPAALAKLCYVDEVVSGLGARAPRVRGGAVMSAASRMRSTLASHYDRRRRGLAQDLKGFFDADLRRVFSGGEGGIPAPEFLAGRRQSLVDTVAHWTREPKYTILKIVDRLVRRSAELGLRVTGPEERAAVETAAFLSALVTG